ncbi:Semaphorin-3A [Tupaia chinensis]|uniref:Semaphorin-3A n=1 Tax=Tupaia chinensis TaxID=246437 RepID=L9K0F6_TUPCH|nr:Semaphorin-3A [Tupaia chinensis]
MGWLTRILFFWGVLLTARANYLNGKNNVPRLKLSYKEMLESNNLVTFSGLANSSSYHTFLLDEERSRLYVGAKDHIFSFNLVNIKDYQKIVWPVSYTRRDECKWAGKDLLKECANFIKVLKMYNQTHLYACGTGAFHPICTYIEIGHHPEDNIFKLEDSHFENGRGKSPYDPKLLTASLLIDPRFISAHLIPESDNPEDDKVYFFFRENAIDGEHSGKATHARIGQICKNDFGGHRSLVNKWTTFLKARLICSVPGPNGIDTHFDELQDVFLMNSKDPKNPIVYGVFTTSSNIFKGSAVCMYSMSDVRRVFLGPYAHRDGPNYQWVPYQGRVPYPRPGTCPSKTFGGFDSTKDLPDDVITFARSHPAMYNPVFPINNRPIMIKTDVNYQFTQIVVDRVDAEDGQYDVMFIGTDNHHGHSLEERIIYGVENSSTFLECSPKSQRALVYWQFQRRNEERKEEIRVDEHIIRTEQGLLLRSLQRKDSGNYLCHAVEHGFMQTLLKVTLEVIDTEHLEELLHKDDDGDGSKTKEMSNSMTPNQKVWYRDFMQLINHPNLNTMDEFCEQVWKRDRKQRRQRPGHSQGNSNKWKHLQENKKGRNRRTHEFERAPRSV